MSEADAWYEDDALLKSELRRARIDRGERPTIPGYRDLEEIGRGGQATVYRATQTSTRQTVAVKVLHEAPGRSASALRRFEREIELIAALRHPAIVTLHDGGTTTEGRPYLVMELVRGGPLDACAAVEALRASPRSEPAIRDLVALMAGVAEGLAFAHRRGVIHRDLKPANILVGDDGTPRILDFGLARVTPGSDLSVGTRSIEGSFAGSLPWTSPEQARGEGADVRSDVYALGVTLFEMLAGRRPYEIPDDLVRALAVVSDPDACRLMEACPAADADLDAIVGRCLAPEADRRYQSVDALHRDLLHWLAGEPIEARRDSAWYTLRRRMRRWRTAVAIAGVVLVATVIALAVSLSSLEDARNARRGEQAETRKAKAALAEAENARSRQAEEAARARATLDWVVDMISRIDPDEDGPDAKIVDLLDRTVPDLDAAFADDVEARLLLRGKIGAIYEKLGRFEAAHLQFTRLLEDVRVARGEDHADTLVGQANLLRMDYWLGRPAVARDALIELVPRIEKALGPDDRETILAASFLALSHRTTEQHVEAERIWKELLEGLPSELEQEMGDVIREHLAGLASMTGRPEEALKIQRRIVDDRDRLHGPDDSRSISARGDLAFYLASLGRRDEAEALYVEALERSRRRLGDDHPRTLTIEENLADLMQNSGRAKEALPRLESVLERRREVLGPRHPKTLVTMNNVAGARARTGDSEGAVSMHREILAVRREILPPDSLDIIITLNNLAGGLNNLGRSDEALPFHVEAVERADRSLGQEHWINAVMRMMYGYCLTCLKDWEKAEPIVLGAHGVLDSVLGTGHPNTATARDLLRRIYRALERPEDEARFAEPKSDGG